MNRRRLALALARSAPLIVVGVAILVLGSVVGVLFLAAGQLHPVLRSIFVGSLTGFFVLPFGLLVVQVLRDLRAPSLANGAVIIERARARRLFEAVAAGASHLGLGEPRNLWISSGFEITAVARGRRYELVIGLPVLDVVDERELKALTAFELALSFSGDPVAAGAYRAGRRLAAIAGGFSNRSGVAPSIAIIVAAGCAALLDLPAVAKERLAFAQREASRLTSDTDLADARVRVSMYATHANEVFWPDIIARHAKNPEPPDAISQLRALSRSALAPEDRLRSFNLAKAELAMEDATLPAERTDTPRASDMLMREIAPALTEAFDKAWRASVADAWTKLHRDAAASLDELSRLETLYDQDRLTAPEAWRRLELIAAHRGEDIALPLFKDWVASNPGDARAALVTGRALLKAGSPEGSTLLRHAIDLDERYAVEACALLAQDLVAQGRADDAKPYVEQRDRTLAAQMAALAERVKDRSLKVLPHGLGEHELRSLAGTDGRPALRFPRAPRRLAAPDIPLPRSRRAFQSELALAPWGEGPGRPRSTLRGAARGAGHRVQPRQLPSAEGAPGAACGGNLPGARHSSQRAPRALGSPSPKRTGGHRSGLGGADRGPQPRLFSRLLR